MFDLEYYLSFSAWIFDLDGTLSNSLAAHNRAWEYALTHNGLPYRYSDMVRLSGVPIPDTVRILASEAGIEVDIDSVVKMRDTEFYHLLPTYLTPTPLVDGVVRPYVGKKPMAVGTGCSTVMARHIMAGIDIDHSIPVVVGADQVQIPKPAPDTFLLAAKKLGVQPDLCLVFEDGDAGLIAAQRAGMKSVDVRPLWSYLEMAQLTDADLAS